MRAKKKLSKQMLALLLSAAMIAEPAGGSIVAHATEADTDLVVENPDDLEMENGEGTAEDSDSMQEDKEDNSADQGSEENNSGDQGSEEDNSGDQGSKEDNSEDQDNKEDNSEADKNEENGEDSEQQGTESSDEEDLEEPDAEEDTDGEDQTDEEEQVADEEAEQMEKEDADENWFSSMPSGYKLSSEQKSMKSALSASMENFDDSAEGKMYVEKQVFAFADTREEAEAIAEAYHAELLEYDQGIVTLKLKEDNSVGNALRVAASLDNNLPAVYPDYYRYKHEEETPQDDSLLEIIEEEYEAEGSSFDASASEEPTIESYEQVVEALGDPNMSYDSNYYQWQHVNVGSVYAWDAGNTGNNVKVAVLDTGVSGNSDVTPIANFNESDEETSNDGDGHGTHVAGIIAAKLNGVGGAGIAPDASIINVKVLNDDGSGSDSNILRGMRRAIAADADIMNMSLGGIGYNPAAQKVVDDAYKAGIAVFVSAGNDGGSNMCYPAAYNHVICIGAVDMGNQRASFSNYGAWVDLSAPGVSIWSTGNDGGFEMMSGTSQACPVAVGEAAVILSSTDPNIVGEFNGKSGGKKVDALENIMKKNAVSAGAGMGKGVTSLPKVFKLSTAVTKPSAPEIKPEVAEDGQSVKFTVKAQAGMTIYYTDNGKAPSFKNGVRGDGTYQATSNEVELTYDGQQKITLSAIAVNASGVSSAVKKVTSQLKPWVTKIEIEGVSKIAKGKTTQLTAEVTPSYATNKKITWSIEGNPANISVNANGKVTTKKDVVADTYTIKAVANDRKGTPNEVVATYSVTILESDYINSVKFTKTKDTISIGKNPEEYNLVEQAGFQPVKKDTYEGTVSESDFVWSSSNKKLATVNAAGVVTAMAPGSVKITATANDGSNKKATFNMTIKQLATSVTITGDSQVAAGASITLKAVVGPNAVSNKNVIWSSDNVDVPVKNGVVKPKKDVTGPVTITATAADGSGAADEKIITVKKGKITGITFETKPSSTIFRTTGRSNAAMSTEFTAKITGVDCALNAYTCTSSNPGIAGVSAVGNDGTVTITVRATGRATGKTTITLMATDGSKKKATCNITVSNPVSKIHITPTGGNSAYVAKGKSLQLKATLESEYGTVSNKKVAWELYQASVNENNQVVMGNRVTDKNAKVTISSSGKITAKKDAVAGIMVVQAKALDASGVTARYVIRVTDPVKSVGLWSYFKDSFGRVKYEKMTSKYIYNFAQIVQTEDQDINDMYGLGGAYPIDIMCDEILENGGYLFKYPLGGVTVSSSNPKVMSAQVGTDPVKGTPVIWLSADNPGNTVITVKAMDGGGAQTKIKFKVVKP